MAEKNIKKTTQAVGKNPNGKSQLKVYTVSHLTPVQLEWTIILLPTELVSILTLWRVLRHVKKAIDYDRWDFPVELRGLLFLLIIIFFVNVVIGRIVLRPFDDARAISSLRNSSDSADPEAFFANWNKIYNDDSKEYCHDYLPLPKSNQTNGLCSEDNFTLYEDSVDIGKEARGAAINMFSEDYYDVWSRDKVCGANIF